MSNRIISRNTTKKASIGGEQEQGFEQAFSSLAYAYLKDKSPRLIDFVVGFQLVDRNEDNTKAIGVFGFKVGDQWLYAPIFFLNGDLKGHELLYIKKQDAFVPMKENWVNYLISRKPHILGEGSRQNTHQLGGLLPNLHRLSQPPGLAKYGFDDIAPWVKDILPCMYAMLTKKASSLYTQRKGDLNFGNVVARPMDAAFAPFRNAFDLRNVLTTLPALKTAFDTIYMRYPKIKKGFDTFYGSDFFIKTAEAIRDSKISIIKKAESYITPPDNAWTSSDSEEPEEPKPFDTSLFSGKKKKKKQTEEKNAGLYVYALDQSVDQEATAGVTINRPELTDEERAKLLKDTVLIKDKRENTSIAYNTQVQTTLINPTETGLHKVLEKPGSFSEMVVICSPHSGRGREDFALVLRKDSPRDWKNMAKTNLWVKSCDCPTPADWKKYVEGLSGTDSLVKGGVYVAIHENGSGTCVFKVREVLEDDTYRVDWRDDIDYDQRRTGLSKAERSYDWTVGYSSFDALVHINKRKGSGLRSVNGELYIPDSYKIIKLSEPKKQPENGMSCCLIIGDDDQSEKSPIQAGNLADVQVFLTKNATDLKVHDIGTRVVLTGKNGTQTFNKTAALISLVRDHGLKEEQARIMLKAASDLRVHNRAAKYFIKYADPYTDLQPGPSAPAFPEPYTGTEQMGPYNSVQAIYPQEDYRPVDGMQAQMTDPSTYDPFYQPDQQAMQVAQQAASSGQKEVFDVAMISGMLKAVRQDTLVDRYLGDLMKALDKLGRILFMFYWHQEEFEDRYGKQDLPELEDSLRNAFEVLGDVVLFLKEKTVGGGPGALNSSGVGAADAGEPNIQEAARN